MEQLNPPPDRIKDSSETTPSTISIGIVRSGNKFCGRLNVTTLIWAVGTGSVYRSKNKAIYAPFALRTSNKRVDRKALVDSGATECFVSPQVVQELGMKTRRLHTPRNVRNVDGTPNKSGKIVEAIDLIIAHRGNKATHVFSVADIGPDA